MKVSLPVASWLEHNGLKYPTLHPAWADLTSSLEIS
jgi:hypothetical protein